MADYVCKSLRKNKVVIIEIQNTKSLESFSFMVNLQNFYRDGKT